MNKKYENLNILGSDETGVGDYLTPLVASAAFVPYQNINKLVDLGVKDSKQLSDQNIIKLAQSIKSLIIYRTKYLSQKGYNKLNKSFNANELKMFLHMSAINDIESKVKDVDMVVIDQFSNANAIKRYYDTLLTKNFDLKPIKAKVILEEKAESKFIAVAAASIMARAFFLEKMAEQNKRWNTTFPLGTNQIVEGFTKDFIKKHGPDVLNEVAKTAFKTTKKLFGN